MPAYKINQMCSWGNSLITKSELKWLLSSSGASKFTTSRKSLSLSSIQRMLKIWDPISRSLIWIWKVNDLLLGCVSTDNSVTEPVKTSVSSELDLAAGDECCDRSVPTLKSFHPFKNRFVIMKPLFRQELIYLYSFPQNNRQSWTTNIVNTDYRQKYEFY